jgi:hypothetical protein
MAGKRKAATGGNGSGSRKGNRPTHYRPQSSRSQRAKLKAYLKLHGSADTVEIRSALNILSPAARIYDLKYKDGLDILSVPDPDTRIAMYHLLGGADS